MKNIVKIFVLLFAFVQVMNAATSTLPHFSFSPNRTVTLKASTSVILELNQRFTADEVKEGTTIKFIVRADVMAEGRVVIKTGALAIGRVTYVKAATYNDKAEVGIELLQVKSVDGQLVDLDGNLSIISGENANESLTTYAGKSLTAQVLNDINIKAD